MEDKTKLSVDLKYKTNHEEDRLKTPFGRIEYLTAMEYLKKYLRRGMRVADIGCGPGAYTKAIAKMGCRVDGVDMSEDNVKKASEACGGLKNVSIRYGDARSLDFVEDGTYDAVLVMGPMYHVFSHDDEMRVLSEAKRIAKKSGLIFIAYCEKDPAVIRYLFVKGLLQHSMAIGEYEPDTCTCNMSPEFGMYLRDIPEIDRIEKEAGFERIVRVAQDGVTPFFNDEFAVMDEYTYTQYLKYHLMICEKPEIVGMSMHVLDILRK